MNNPQVSIGMPVYNGEPFLLKTLDAILAQTYQDFELIIYDNASTDNTEKICRQYAAQDKRISYYRHQQNIGAAGEPITSAHQIPDYYGYAVWFDPALRGQIIFPHWRIFWEYCSCIWQSQLSIRAKISCHFSIFKQLQGMKLLLARDFVISARQSFDLFASNLRETLVVNANSK